MVLARSLSDDVLVMVNLKVLEIHDIALQRVEYNKKKKSVPKYSCWA